MFRWTVHASVRKYRIAVLRVRTGVHTESAPFFQLFLMRSEHMLRHVAVLRKKALHPASFVKVLHRFCAVAPEHFVEKF